MINVEVAYAMPDAQIIFLLQVEDSATLIEAIQLSTILERFPEINLKLNQVGIFGKIAKLNAVLRNKDRIEIYRPLLSDPKEVRRQRAARAKQAKRK